MQQPAVETSNNAKKVAKKLDMELEAVEDQRQLIRVVCRVKKTGVNVQSCIKSMTSQTLDLWCVSNPNMMNASSKKRKHNNSGQEMVSASHAYSFDRVYGGNTTQQHFYDGEISSIVLKLLSGDDSTIFAYGNTNSGKSYTIFGKPNQHNRKTTDGILFRVVQDIFKKEPDRISLKISAFEIYNEKVFDLLCRVSC